MGGASTWNFAVHYTDLWAAAAPGAGFSESPKFLKLQVDTLPDFERKLLHMYDCIDWAANLSQLPVVAYSGEIDGQKQAADIMEKAMAKEGLKLTHVIGPKTGHSYEKNAKIEVNRLVDAHADKGRDPLPRKIRFVTYTLRYPKMFWVHVDGMGQHWEEARVEADIVNDNTVKVSTKNVTALTLNMPAGLCPLDQTRPPQVQIDGQTLNAGRRGQQSFLGQSLPQRRWRLERGCLRRRRFAFASSLSCRAPLTTPSWTAFSWSGPRAKPTTKRLESGRKRRWPTRLSTGAASFVARLCKRTMPTCRTRTTSLRVTWSFGAIHTGNKLLARILSLGKLPLTWTTEKIRFAGQEYASDHHTIAMIFPNPLNPKKYVVLNSGFTFREFDYLNNARQIPKLGDYAVLDLAIPADARRPAGIVTSGFFNERWEAPTKR